MSLKASLMLQKEALQEKKKKKNILLTITLIILYQINYVEVWRGDGLALYSPVFRRYEFYKVNFNFFF